MRRVLSAVLVLQGLVFVAQAVQINVWRGDGDPVYDAAVIVLGDKRCDSEQRMFLERFVNNEGLSFFDRMLAAQGKESGDVRLPTNQSRLMSWMTLTSLPKKLKQQEILEQLRKSVGKKFQAIAREGIESVAVVLPASLGAAVGGWSVVLRELAVVAQLATHSFTYSTKTPQSRLQRIDFVVPLDQIDEDCLAWGNKIGHYTNLARRWGEEPAGVLTPQLWAQQAAFEAGMVGCSCTILDEGRIRELGMGGVLGVTAGSAKPPVVIVVEYAPANYKATIALVGKGIIFDSGGLQIKSGSSMLNMKYDKCGGAAALATCFAVAAIKAPIRVVAVVPAVYNKTGSNAMHARDVLHMMNGKTVEVYNTDAEGRLILADGLHYVEKFYNPDVVIDIATLTGACIVALGYDYSGLMSRNDRLKRDLIAAGNVTGDRLWELPLERSYGAANDAEMADISNCGRMAYGAGAITAGLFLENFVKNPCWAHLDIAGPSALSPTSWLGSTGTTGAGVRLLVEYITNYQVDVNGNAAGLDA
jgi:leucyl aminopeptidase